MYGADIFFIFTVCNTQRLRRGLKVEEMLNFSVSILINTETQRINIAQLFICKGEKVANACYLENIADFYESYNLYYVEWVGLITPGHHRIPQDTQVTPRYISQDAFYFLYNSFIYSFRRKQSKNDIQFFSFQVHSFKKVLLNTAETP